MMPLQRLDACRALFQLVARRQRALVLNESTGSVQSGGGSSVARLGGSVGEAFAEGCTGERGTDGAAGGFRVRAASKISAVLPPTTSRPPTSDPIATQSRNDSLAPRSMSAAMPREPSAFMTTTDQSPSRTFQVTVCVPTPEAEA